MLKINEENQNCGPEDDDQNLDSEVRDAESENDDLAVEERKLFREFRKAEEKGDVPGIAHCLHSLGNLYEKRQIIGTAFRNWSYALYLYNQMGVPFSSNAERIRFLLRKWSKYQSVFISYARKDSPRVYKVLDFLKQNDVAFKIDEEFLAGRSIQRQINWAMAYCPKAIIFYSANYLDRTWTTYELEYLLENRRQNQAMKAYDNAIIFFCLDDEEPGDDFSDDLLIKWSGTVDEPDTDCLNALLKAVKGSIFSL